MFSMTLWKIFAVDTHFKQLRKRSLKKNLNRLQRDSNPWPLRYRCSALPTELWSHNCWEKVNFSGSIMPLRIVLHYSDWVCTVVISNDVMKDLRKDYLKKKSVAFEIWFSSSFCSGYMSCACQEDIISCWFITQQWTRCAALSLIATFVIFCSLHQTFGFWKGMYISFVCSCLEDRSTFKWQYSKTIVQLEVILQYVGMTWHETKQTPKYRDCCKHVIFLWTLCRACMFLHAFYIWNAISGNSGVYKRKRNSWPVSFGLNKFHSPCK